MILIEDNKYSCIECIRGHRSSQCKHSERPLLQVRAKGRPNIQNNPNYRIAVFAKEFDEQAKDIKITKASIKYIIDFKSGDILGPYDDESSKILKPNIPKINNNSFIISSSCCSNGLVKKSCGCNHTTSKSKILKSYLKTNKKFKFINNNNEAKRESLKDEINKKLTNCTCDDDCKCDGCLIHSNKFEFNDIFKLNTSDSINRTSIDNELNGQLQTSFPPFYNQMVQNELIESINDLQNDSLDGSETNETNDVNGISNINDTKGKNDISQINECSCAADNCQCLNCEKHGIINGIKLDDIFNGLDQKLFSI